MTELFPVLLVLCRMSYVSWWGRMTLQVWPVARSGKLIYCMILGVRSNLYISNHASILDNNCVLRSICSDDRCVDQHSTYTRYKDVVVVQVYSLDSRHLISNTGLPAAPNAYTLVVWQNDYSTGRSSSTPKDRVARIWGCGCFHFVYRRRSTVSVFLYVHIFYI